MLKELEELQKQANAELLISKTEESSWHKNKYSGEKASSQGFFATSECRTGEEALVGNRCNEIKHTLTEKIERALSAISRLKQDDYLLRERIDVTLPAEKSG